VALGLALALPLRLAAETATFTPYQAKALYLFKFAMFTEWPKEAFASDDSPLVLGILGKDPFGKDIDVIKGKSVKGRKLVVKYFSTVEEATGCQLLFIASSETNRLEQILKAFEKTSVMTIAEADGFLQANGMINLVTERKSTGTLSFGFEINLAAAQKANLKLNAELLKWAKQVKT
jgi:hypothetical protein